MLYLDDVCAEVRKQDGCKRGRYHVARVDHAHARQGFLAAWLRKGKCIVLLGVPCHVPASFTLTHIKARCAYAGRSTGVVRVDVPRRRARASSPAGEGYGSLIIATILLHLGNVKASIL